MSNKGYYFHPAGYPSRWGVVDVGLKCTHACRFCYYLYLDGTDDPTAGMRHAKFHEEDHILAVVDSLADNGFVGFDVTGGEPALCPSICAAIRRATDRGLSSRIITLGQWLMRPMHGSKNILIDDLLSAGVTNFLFSYHSCDEGLFHHITGGSLSKLESAMSYLDDKGFHYTTNTTVYEDNYKTLPDIARRLVRSGTYLHNFIVMNAYYEWAKEGRATPIQARYGEVGPYLREAVSILEGAGIGVNIRYAPVCTIAGLEKNHVGIVGVRYDPYEWMNHVDHQGNVDGVRSGHDQGRRISVDARLPSPGAYLFQVKGDVGELAIHAGRGIEGNISKVMPRLPCQACSAINVCDGIDPRYLQTHGNKEFIPYVNDDRGTMLDKARLTYRAPFFVKLKPGADMRSAVRESFFPRPVGSNPKVSVIITNFNYGQYLGECLRSVIAQTYQNIELAVVDDASTDDSHDIIYKCLDGSRFDNNTSQGSLSVARLTKNTGQPACTRNVGFGLSTGELILCLDADDRISPTMVEECVRKFQEHPEASIVYTGVKCFGDSDNEWAAPAFNYGSLIQQNFICYCSMYRRKVWDDVGGYKTNVRGTEDWSFWIEATGLGHVAVPLPRQLWYYRVHSDGIFQTDVQPNLEAKFRQIVLNNPELYSPQQVVLAKQGKDVPRLIG